MANPNPRQIENRENAVALFGGGPLFPYYFAALGQLKNRVGAQVVTQSNAMLETALTQAETAEQTKITAEEAAAGAPLAANVKTERIAEARKVARQVFYGSDYFKNILPSYKNELACAIMGATFVTERRALEEARDKADKAATDTFSSPDALRANPFMLEASQLWRRFLYGADTTNSAEHLAALRNNTTEGNAKNVQWFIGQLRALKATLPENSSIRDLTPNQFAAQFAKTQITNPALYELLRDGVIRDRLRIALGVPSATAATATTPATYGLTADNLLEKVSAHVTTAARSEELIRNFSDATTLATLFPEGTANAVEKREAFKNNLRSELNTASPKWSLYQLLSNNPLDAAKPDLGTIKNAFAEQIGVANPDELTPDNLFEKLLNHLGESGSPQELERAQKLLTNKQILEAFFPKTVKDFQAKRDAFKEKISGELNTLLEARRIPLVNNTYIADSYVTPIATAENKIKDAAEQYTEPYKVLRDAFIASGTPTDAVRATRTTQVTEVETAIARNQNYQIETNAYLDQIGEQLKTWASSAPVGFAPTDPAISNTNYAINVFRTASAGVNFNELSDTARQAKIFSAIQQLSTKGNALTTLLNAAPAKQVVADALGVNADTLTAANLPEKLVEATAAQIEQITDGLRPPALSAADIANLTRHITSLRTVPRPPALSGEQANLANYYATQIPQRPNVTKALLNAPDRQQLIQTVQADNQSFEQNFQYSNLDVRAQAEIRASAVYAEMLEKQITASDKALAADPDAADPDNETLQKNKQQLVTQKNYVDNFRNNVGLYRTSLERADAGLPLIEPARTPSFGERIWMRLKPSIFNTDSYRRSATILTADQTSPAYTSADGFKQTIGRTVIDSKNDVVEERIRVTDLQGKPVGERLNFVSDPKAFLSAKKEKKQEDVNGVPTMVEQPSEMENSAVKCLSHGFNNGGMLTYDPAEKKFQLPPPGLNFDKEYYDIKLKRIDDPWVRLLMPIFAKITAVEALAFNTAALAAVIPFRALASGVSALFDGDPISIMPNTKPLLESFRNRSMSPKEKATNELQQALVNLWFQEKLTEPTTVTEKDPKTGKDVQVPISGLLSKSHCISADVKKAKKEITSDGEGKKVYDAMNAPGGLLNSLDAEFNQRLQALEAKQDPTKVNANKADNCAQVMADMLKNRGGSLPPTVIQNYVNLLEDQLNRPNSAANTSSTVTVQPGRTRPSI